MPRQLFFPKETKHLYFVKQDDEDPERTLFFKIGVQVLYNMGLVIKYTWRTQTYCVKGRLTNATGMTRSAFRRRFPQLAKIALEEIAAFEVVNGSQGL